MSLGAQGCLFNDAEQNAAAFPDDDDNDETDTSKPAPKKRVEHDLDEAEKVCACCQNALHRMGKEMSEQLDIIAATVQVIQHVRFKYACRHCDRHGEASRIVISAMPPQPLPGSNASAGAVATVLTAKYADGMPLYRQHDWLLRGEVDVARGRWCCSTTRPAAATPIRSASWTATRVQS